MRILHTSDWHLGRTFHGHSTLPQLREVLGAIPAMVRDHDVDAVLVAGDVFDHAAPAAELYEVLAWAIREIRAAGAAVVVSSGNHDNATRLGFQSEWAALGGVHVLTRPDAFRAPLELGDAHGPVDVYAIPYLEPMLQQGLYPGESLREHRALLARVMGEVNALRETRGRRSVVLAHCFAVNVGAGGVDSGGVDSADADSAGAGRAHRGAGATGSAGRGPDGGGFADDPGAGLVWDLTAGGLDLVPASVFDGPDYVALGHLHGRSILGARVRYSGAPVHFSFSEARSPRGAWLVELDADGFAGARWLALPVPRPLARIRGRIDELLADPALAEHEGSWVEATLTDPARPIDAMRRLRERFPYCARIEFAPEGAAESERRSYASRVAGRSDTELVDEFLRHVRGGEGLDGEEREVLVEVFAEAVGEGRS